jgi:hypothetical protein
MVYTWPKGLSKGRRVLATGAVDVADSLRICAGGLFLHATARMNTDDGWILLALFEAREKKEVTRHIDVAVLKLGTSHGAISNLEFGISH